MARQDSFLDAKTYKDLTSRQLSAMLPLLEALMAPNLRLRKEAFEALIALNAHLRSPLAAAVLALNLREPDLELRSGIVSALAALFETRPSQTQPNERVLLWVQHVLGAMRTREIFALLQVMSASPELRESVFSLIRNCSFSGETLVRILKDRQTGIPIRIAAAEAIAEVGFLAAKNALNELYQRIAGREAGQMQMAFASCTEAEIEELLPALRNAIRVLEEAED